MLSVSSRIRFTLLATAAVLVSASAGATVVTYVGTQGPNLDIPKPPVIGSSIQTQLDAFGAKSVILGSTGFETLVDPTKPLGAVQKDFSYNTGDAANPTGSATFSGGAIWFSEQGSETGRDYIPSAGRYNMTLNAGNQPPNIGHWLESSSDFRYTFQPGVSALSFYVTDLGDIDLDTEVMVILYDTKGVEVGRKALVNTATGELPVLDANGSPVLVDGKPLTTTTSNGNLLFFGATNDAGDFGSLVFSIKQGTGTANGLDWIGFDELKVGQYRNDIGGTPIPEPASLALVGLALAAGGLARRRATR